MKNILDLQLIIGGEADLALIEVSAEITEGSDVAILPKPPVLDMINPFSDPEFVPAAIEEIVAVVASEEITV